ncbi:RNA 2'-phosphotransferase [Streptomyces sp. BE20]|uniref:RNA 2'-phosphotransferase n=1 Tax=Streptomycetaceae TaxID=2062 RepID=UPI002E78D513|nr:MULTISPECIES: RNA 2'-phosphotransferase [unclassified Streptomyces]MED7950532.1 RNA 2'-phosphotransferase [Streptomyces sp. BE303]MEE1827259.1 RNA 2'-phosphotransferase [Streptomyces sp. BE20]
MDEKRTVRTSKMLSRILRHEPERVGVTLDGAGWVRVDVLLAALAARGTRLTRVELDHVVATNNKRRFAYSEDGLSIRASQGHTVAVDLGLAAAAPPAVLFHGTAARSLDAIFREGLRPMARQDVHLSADTGTATRVGARHGRPVVLEVDAAAMAAAGHEFRISANGVWLTDAVPPEYLSQP